MKTVHALSIALLLGLPPHSAPRRDPGRDGQPRSRRRRAASARPRRKPDWRVSTAGSTSCSAHSTGGLRSCRDSCTSPRVAAPAAPAPALRSPRRRSGAAHDLRPRQGAARPHIAGTSTSTKAQSGDGATMTNHVARLYALAALADRLLRRVARGLGPPVAAGREARLRPPTRRWPALKRASATCARRRGGST